MEILIRGAASDLGLHCLQITLLGVSRLQWVKGPIIIVVTKTFFFFFFFFFISFSEKIRLEI